MLVELKNGETYNGHLVSCDTWMNVHLREVICTSKDGDRFWRMANCRAGQHDQVHLRARRGHRAGAGGEPQEVPDEAPGRGTGARRQGRRQGPGRRRQGRPGRQGRPRRVISARGGGGAIGFGEFFFWKIPGRTPRARALTGFPRGGARFVVILATRVGVALKVAQKLSSCRAPDPPTRQNPSRPPILSVLFFATRYSAHPPTR